MTYSVGDVGSRGPSCVHCGPVPVLPFSLKDSIISVQ